ncbi:hypothetical protein HMPREF0083_05889 [Aneurinibacillus aneurinilyticus ATCC 12856]|uniref:Uncharacterized protein n=1 Tax=Aneurinibacillus aneurinilyticus ATCC 12856 TaxID=649747 RepID=U1WQI9_ANEAE|nr:hypothetical protein HMPREF0083_05889 [Aneurinibacillus aneurinilyticus ATCC 12856]
METYVPFLCKKKSSIELQLFIILYIYIYVIIFSVVYNNSLPDP